VAVDAVHEQRGREVPGAHLLHEQLLHRLGVLLQAQQREEDPQVGDGVLLGGARGLDLLLERQRVLLFKAHAGAHCLQGELLARADGVRHAPLAVGAVGAGQARAGLLKEQQVLAQLAHDGPLRLALAVRRLQQEADHRGEVVRLRGADDAEDGLDGLAIGLGREVQVGQGVQHDNHELLVLEHHALQDSRQFRGLGVADDLRERGDDVLLQQHRGRLQNLDQLVCDALAVHKIVQPAQLVQNEPWRVLGEREHVLVAEVRVLGQLFEDAAGHLRLHQLDAE
jgi:hypothetical protein